MNSNVWIIDGKQNSWRLVRIRKYSIFNQFTWPNTEMYSTHTKCIQQVHCCTIKVRIKGLKIVLFSLLLSLQYMYNVCSVYNMCTGTWLWNAPTDIHVQYFFLFYFPTCTDHIHSVGEWSVWQSLYMYIVHVLWLADLGHVSVSYWDTINNSRQRVSFPSLFALMVSRLNVT